MKWKWLLMPLAWAAVSSLYAQSCCTSGAGSNWGIIPELSKNYVGLRYTFRDNHSIYPASLNPELSGKHTEERMHSLDLNGRFNLHRKLQLLVSVPVRFIIQQSETTSRNMGLGDMAFMLQYAVYNPAECSGPAGRHKLRIGAGVKLPSGHFIMQTNNTFVTNLQTGSGSVDFLFNALYTYRIKNFGFNLTGNYKLNTTNTQQYKFGDNIQASWQAFYIINARSVSFAPVAGINFEHNFPNWKNKDVLSYSGGDVVSTTAGLNIYYKRFVFAQSFTPAVMNHLNWSGELRQKWSTETAVYYNF